MMGMCTCMKSVGKGVSIISALECECLYEMRIGSMGSAWGGRYGVV